LIRKYSPAYIRRRLAFTGGKVSRLIKLSERSFANEVDFLSGWHDTFDISRRWWPHGCRDRAVASRGGSQCQKAGKFWPCVKDQVYQVYEWMISLWNEWKSNGNNRDNSYAPTLIKWLKSLVYYNISVLQDVKWENSLCFYIYIYIGEK